MATFYKLHKLHTYTDESLIYYTHNHILVYVYARAELSEELEKLRYYPRSEVTSHPIKIMVHLPIHDMEDTTEHILASAEALAQ